VSALRDRLEADLRTAMRARDEVTRDTLRMVLSSIKKREIDEDRPTSDEDVLAILAHATKTRQDSAEQFEQAGRPELAAKERQELAVVARYLPEKLSEDEVRTIVQGLVRELGIESRKDLGRLMKELMARHRGEIDGKTAQRIAGELVG